jgi:CheY-like chemotaxis protein
MYRKPWKRHYLSPGETAEIFKVTPASLRGWTSKGTIRAEITKGGHRRYPLSEVFRLAQLKGIELEPTLFKPVKLLVLDSDAEHAKVIQESLNDVCGVADVMLTHDCFTAGCLVTQFKPDIVLLDLKLPGIDSSRICSFIKHDPQTRFIRVLAMCQNCTQQQHNQILDLGAEVCLSKPVSKTQLKQAMGLVDLDG